MGSRVSGEGLRHVQRMQDAGGLIDRAAEDRQATSPMLGHQPSCVGDRGLLRNGDHVDARHHCVAQPEIRQFDYCLQPIAEVAWYDASTGGCLQHHQEGAAVTWRTDRRECPIHFPHPRSGPDWTMALPEGEANSTRAATRSAWPRTSRTTSRNVSRAGSSAI